MSGIFCGTACGSGTGNKKPHNIEKIAHYVELAWIISEGKVIKTDKRDRKRSRLSPPDASSAAIFDW